MEPEEGVTGGGSEITSGVTAKDEVTSGVHTHETVLEVVRRRAALESLPELLIGGLLDQGDNIVVLEPAFAGEAGDVAGDAARVVAETEGGAKLHVRVEGSAGRAGKNGAKVDRPVLEGTGSDASTSDAMRDLDQRVLVERNAGPRLIRATQDAISTKGGRRAIKQRGLQGILGPPRVAVIGLGTLIAALIAQGLLVNPHEVTVPRKEVTRHVDAEGLLDMNRNKVVIAVAASWALLLRVFGGRIGQALNCRDICLLLVRGEGGPSYYQPQSLWNLVQ